MATYKGIQGYSVQTLASDPTAANVEGQLWYNSTSSTYKIAVAAAGAWSSGNNVNDARDEATLTGTVTAAIIAGGEPNTVNCETYNGSTWTEVNNCNTARNQGCTGIGVQTGALFVGGQPSPAYVEQWDGTSWTEVADLATGRYGLGGTGTSSLGLIGAGEPLLTSVEEWNDPAYSAKTVTVS